MARVDDWGDSAQGLGTIKRLLRSRRSFGREGIGWSGTAGIWARRVQRNCEAWPARIFAASRASLGRSPRDFLSFSGQAGSPIPGGCSQNSWAITIPHCYQSSGSRGRKIFEKVAPDLSSPTTARPWHGDRSACSDIMCSATAPIPDSASRRAPAAFLPGKRSAAAAQKPKSRFIERSKSCKGDAGTGCR